LPAGLTLPASVVGSTITLNLSFADGQANATPQGDDDQGDDDSTNQSTATIGAGTSGSIAVTGGHGDHHGGGGGDDN